MNLIISMSVSGSICMVFSMLLQRAERRFSLYKWQDLLLKMALFLYLVPCPLALMVRRLWENEQRRAVGAGLRDIRISPSKASMLMYGEGMIANWGFGVFAVITVGTLAVALFRLFRKVSGYISGKRVVMSADVYRKADIAEGELEELKEKVRLRRNIQIYEISFPGGAFTVGYFHPVIMIPENLGRQQRDIVLLHEMYHIKRNDILFKFLVAAAICIHWFNPLIYLLPGLVNRNCELNCDERVIRNLSREERLVYGREIYRQGALAQEERDVLVRLGGDRTLTKTSLIGERVKNIMKENRRNIGRTAKCLMGVLTLVILIISSVPVFACDGVTVIDISGEEGAMQKQHEKFFMSDVLFTANESNLFETENIDIRYDRQFTDEDGNIYEIDIKESSRAGCTHSTLTSGKYQEHVKNSSGGCVVKTYTANYCSGCGQILTKDLISETKYVKCPH